MNIEEFKSIIESLIRNIELVEDNDELLKYKIRENEIITTKEEINEILNLIPTYNSENETDLYNDNYYEILVRFDQRMPLSIRMREHDKFSLTDHINKIEYEISHGSKIYISNFLDKLNQMDVVSDLRRRFMLPSHRIDRICENEDNVNIFTLLQYVLRIETIKIKSETKKLRSDFEKLSYSYIFNLGVNLDLPIYPLRYLDEFASRARIRMRRAKPEEIEAPKRIYINDLVLFYQRGIVSESLDNQFLSFYHILEHFFDEVYNEDLLESVKKEISRGTFSYKRKKDITKLVDLIKKKLKYKNDEFLIQEDEALTLTLKKFIPEIEDLKQEIIDFDSDLIDFYKTNDVIFSKGNKVNFNVQNEDEIFKNLSKRIYLTRNAIVHSKETEKERNKYLPFRDDKHLIKENVLLRLIAEKIIFESSKEI